MINLQGCRLRDFQTGVTSPFSDEALFYWIVKTDGNLVISNWYRTCSAATAYSVSNFETTDQDTFFAYFLDPRHADNRSITSLAAMTSQGPTGHAAEFQSPQPTLP